MKGLANIFTKFSPSENNHVYSTLFALILNILQYYLPSKHLCFQNTEGIDLNILTLDGKLPEEMATNRRLIKLVQSARKGQPVTRYGY